MPRVKPLGKAQQEAVKKEKRDQAFLDVLALFKVRNDKSDKDAAKKLGLHCSKFARIKKDPSNASLGDIRDAMHKLGGTPEQWLQLGGFS